MPIKDASSIEQKLLANLVEIIVSLNIELQKISQKFQRTIQRKFFIEELPGKLQDWTYKKFISELAKKKIKLSLAEEAEWETYFSDESKKALVIKSRIDATDREIDRWSTNFMI